MTAANFQAPGVARDQGQADAEVFLIAQQAIRIVHPERNADNCRDRRQRDVTLVKIQADSEDFFALVVIPADDAAIRDGSGVGTRCWSGQAETGNEFATSEAGQEVVFLFLGAVMQKEFAGAQ